MAVKLEEIRSKSIIGYLESNGLNGKRRGKCVYFSSPFSEDKTPSFAVYPSNYFVDYSTGKRGSIIDLIMMMEECSIHEAIKIIESGDLPDIDFTKSVKNRRMLNSFNIEHFFVYDQDEVDAIDKYAKSRGISNGYYPAYYYLGEQRVLAMMFPHVDESLKLCGAKFRRIDGGEPRFSSRGVSGFYIMEPPLSGSSNLFLCESETSANSCFEYLKFKGNSSIVISMGGVYNARNLPDRYNSLTIKNKYLIIDYDGNEELYEKRLELYRHLNLKPIRMPLDKGEDINSLWAAKNIAELDKYLNI